MTKDSSNLRVMSYDTPYLRTRDGVQLVTLSLGVVVPGCFKLAISSGGPASSAGTWTGTSVLEHFQQQHLRGLRLRGVMILSH